MLRTLEVTDSNLDRCDRLMSEKFVVIFPCRFMQIDLKQSKTDFSQITIRNHPAIVPR
jgi:hypothetical protein